MSVPLELRPLQVRGIERVRDELRAGRKRVCFVAPCGYGKTRVASELIRRAVAKGNRVLFTVHLREIVRETAKRLADLGVPCGVVMADEPAPANVPVLVCSTPTLHVRGQRPPADLLIHDEAHHLVAQTFRAIAGDPAYADAVHLGLTATPERSDGVGLGDVFESLVVGALPSELLAANLLVPTDVIAPPYRMSDLASDPVDAWQRAAAGRRTIVFAKTVRQAQEIAARFASRGVPVGLVDGTTAKKKRDTTLETFGSGQLLVLVNVACLTEGVDVPGAEVCVLARSCGSLSTFVQIVGRVQRSAPGKTRALLIDLYGAVHEHGLPDEDRVWTLDGLAPKEKARTSVRQCPQCGAVFRSKPKCPLCAFELPPPPPPKVDAVRMGRADRVVPAHVKLDKWVALCRTAHARGFKPGWAYHRFVGAFGHGPARNFPSYDEATR